MADDNTSTTVDNLCAFVAKATEIKPSVMAELVILNRIWDKAADLKSPVFWRGSLKDDNPDLSHAHKIAKGKRQQRLSK